MLKGASGFEFDSVSLLQAHKHFLLVEANAVYLFSYEGRLVCSPKWQVSCKKEKRRGFSGMKK